MNFRRLILKKDTIHLKNLKQKFTATLFSDIHIDTKGSIKMLKKAIALSNKQEPDVVFLLGDYVTMSDSVTKHFDPIKDIKSKHGVYGILGNHDYYSNILLKSKKVADSITAKLTSLNVKMLRNQNKLIKIKNNFVNLIGLDSYTAKEINTKKAFKDLDDSHPKILLTHHPDSVLKVMDNKTDIMFCGHTHGSTFRVPYFGTLYLPNKIGKFYDRWLKDYKGQKMFISCGFGKSILDFRLFNPPEVNLIEFVPQ